MFRIIRPLHGLLMPPVVGFLLLIVVAPSCRKTSSPPDQSGAQSKPQAKEPAGPSPSSILAGRKLHNAPALAGAGDDARRSVASFIDCAGASLPEEQEDGRRMLEGARENKDFVTTFSGIGVGILNRGSETPLYYSSSRIFSVGVIYQVVGLGDRVEVSRKGAKKRKTEGAKRNT